MSGIVRIGFVLVASENETVDFEGADDAVMSLTLDRKTFEVLGEPTQVFVVRDDLTEARPE